MSDDRVVPVARLGELERAVMEVLWDLPVPPGGRGDDPAPTATARQVAEALAATRSLAYTTVLTVLDRLERKGLVRRLRAGRAHRYAPAATRKDYVAELMLEALGRASDSDRDAALMRFVDSVSGEEAEVLRRALLGDGEGDAGADGGRATDGEGVTVSRSGADRSAGDAAAERARDRPGERTTDQSGEGRWRPR